MAPRWLRSRPERPAWPDLRARLLAVAAEQFPATAFAVSGADDDAVVRWTDGPGPDTLVGALGDLPDWILVAGAPADDIDPSAPVLHLDRTLSDPALAVAIVRFYASQGRHWSSSEGAVGRDAWRTLTGIDDPAPSGYPIADAVARLLVGEPDPPGLPHGPNRAEVLSAKLAAVGYERLWAIAFAEVP